MVTKTHGGSCSQERFYVTESLKIGVVGVVGGWSSEALADRVAERTGFRLVIDMEGTCARLQEGKVLYQGHDLTKFDALIVKKVGQLYSSDMLDRLEVLRYVEGCGVRVFSKPRAIMALLDRLSCTVTLATHGIPMPPTAVTEDVDEALSIVRQYERAVLKPLYSTKARGMTVVAAGAAELRTKLEQFKADGNPVMYIQKMLELPGKDLGVMFLGGQYVGTYARVGKGDSWNTTIHSGGHYEAHDPGDEIVELARRAQAPFDLDLTSVDVVETESGPMVFEVSAFGGFSGLREGCNKDAAALYADYVIRQLKDGNQ